MGVWFRYYVKNSILIFWEVYCNDTSFWYPLIMSIYGGVHCHDTVLHMYFCVMKSVLVHKPYVCICFFLLRKLSFSVVKMILSGFQFLIEIIWCCFTLVIGKCWCMRAILRPFSDHAECCPSGCKIHLAFVLTWGTQLLPWILGHWWGSECVWRYLCETSLVAVVSSEACWGW